MSKRLFIGESFSPGGGRVWSEKKRELQLVKSRENSKAAVRKRVVGGGRKA
jgi:hypothetical protein